MNKLGVYYQRDTEKLMLSGNGLLEEKACNSVVNTVLRSYVSTGGIRKNIFHCAQLEGEEAW